MEFFEAPAFTRYVSSYLTDDEYREMQGRLASIRTGSWRHDSGDRRLSQAAMGRPKARKRAERRPTGHLLLLLRRKPDLSNNPLR